jgi:hypothetical protein
MKSVIQNGKVINVGEWDSQSSDRAAVAPTLPEGAIEGEFDLVQNAKGEFVLSTDYRKLRSAEYPSIGDQLDSLFKAGVFPEDMARLIEQVKSKYPKPEQAV